MEELTDTYFLSGIEILNDLVSIPNDAQDQDQLWPNLKWCEEAFKDRGWQTQKLATKGFPILLAERPVADAIKTVLFYFHIDGQPVDHRLWNQENPYEAVLKMNKGDGWLEIPMDTLQLAYNPEWRIFGRSVSDDKGPLAMFLTAWDALRASEQWPNYNLKIILDFEEEIGSPNLPEAVFDHRKLLAADMMLIMDGPRHVSNQPTLTFGARGIAEITLTTYGPAVPQHSGHYGNYAPNPALRLAQLLGSMKDETGRVIIPGFYDGISLTKKEQEILKSVPDDESEINRKLGIAEPDRVGISYQESIQYPSLNIRGMASGWVGKEARTIVPAEAIAEIDVRLVPESDPERLFQLIREHISSQGYFLLDSAPTRKERLTHPKLIQWQGNIAYQAFRTSFDSEPGLWLNKAYHRAFGMDPIKIRIGGGSIPISPFVDALGLPAVSVVTVNPDNNQHSPNENLRLGNFKEGIKTILAILTETL
ncbi:M20/M25/M40 family metallo-hydrolase [Pararhodonellum marinum]|uniref:M20/M25/M40 family metallo-hydrolase n=1 Tax=Pararhodonellum marinum TaxID=2755358 RepID=UPI001E56EF0F|nr:M20/M25/M40 family metallo-hydrolase [Pararhodonellum marinum]